MEREQWEKYCHALLSIRHPSSFQPVPSRFGGDLGIDGFTLDGTLFQCYCPDGNSTGRDLYEKQRDKITRDIRKLNRNMTRIAGLVPSLLTEWHFVTPKYENKDLIQHCRKKEEEVRTKAHPAISDGFRILLQREDDFIPERQIYIGSSALRLQATAVLPMSDDVEELLESESGIILNIQRKVGNLNVPPGSHSQLVRRLVMDYIIGQDELQALNSKLPQTYTEVTQLKDAMEAQLPVRIAEMENGHGAVLRDTLKDYEAKLACEFSHALSSVLITRLSSEAISDWLGRCPLDPNPGGGNRNAVN